MIQNGVPWTCGLQMAYARFLRIRPNELKDAFAGGAPAQVRWSQLPDGAAQEIATVELVDELDEDARRFGAINTIAFRDGRMIGSNTGWDWVYPCDSGSEFSVDLKDLRVLLLGAGGARTCHSMAMRPGAGCERLASCQSHLR